MHRTVDFYSRDAEQEMASSRISISTNLSANPREQRQAQARIRALQRRTNALYEDLSRSSFVAKAAAEDYKQAYATITNEFEEQREQLLQHLRHIKQDIKQSTVELSNLHKHLHTVQSQRSPSKKSSDSSINPGNVNDHQMSELIDDIDRVLNKIAQQLRPFRFVPLNDPPTSRTHDSRFDRASHLRSARLPSTLPQIHQHAPIEGLSLHRLYTIDVNITPQWIVATIDKRIFACDADGAVRIFSYLPGLRRQPLLIEHFHLATRRLIAAFTVTDDYLVASETPTKTLTLHTHHGGILVRLPFPLDPVMMVRNVRHKHNQIWTCSYSKRQCHRLSLDHSTKAVTIIDEYNLTTPISGAVIAPVGIATDEHDRLAVHDVNTVSLDRLVVFADDAFTATTLDFVKYQRSLGSSRIERVLLVPQQEHLAVIVYAPRASSSALREIVIIDMSVVPAQLLYRLPEPNGVQGIDMTLSGELVYAVPMQKNRHVATKLRICRLFH